MITSNLVARAIVDEHSGTDDQRSRQQLREEFLNNEINNLPDDQPTEMMNIIADLHEGKAKPICAMTMNEIIVAILDQGCAQCEAKLAMINMSASTTKLTCMECERKNANAASAHMAIVLDRKRGNATPRLTMFDCDWSVETWRDGKSFVTQIKDRDGNQRGSADLNENGEADYSGSADSAKLAHERAIRLVMSQAAISCDICGETVLEADIQISKRQETICKSCFGKA